MVHGTVKGLLGLISTLVLIILALTAALAYRLDKGPVSLSILTPEIEQALQAPDGSIAVKLDATLLVWNRDSLTLEIHVRGARVITAGQGTVASLPEMSVVLSGPALLHGEVALRAIRLIHPHLHLVRDAQGHFEFGVSGEQTDTGENANGLLQATLQALLAPPGGTSPAGQLRRVEVAAGDLEFVDQALGMNWHAPRTDLVLSRNQQGISGRAHLDLDLDGTIVDLAGDGLYMRGENAIDGRAVWKGLQPPILARLDPALAPLAALQITTDGSVGFRYSLVNQSLAGLHLDAKAGAGTIDGTAWFGMKWPVAGLILRGSLDGDSGQLSLDELRISLPAQATKGAPAAGPVITASGAVTDIANGAKIDASAHIEEIPVDTVKAMWPASLAPNPRTWIVANMSGGTVHQAALKLAAHLPRGGGMGDMVVDKADGEMEGDGITVHYLGALPPVQKASAVALFDQNAMSITVRGGSTAGLAIQGGTILLSGFMNPDQFADISLKIAGPVADALRLIDNKPLRYASALGFDPETVKGDAVTQLDLRFPVANSTTFDKIKLHVHSETSGLAMRHVAFGVDLGDGALALDVDPQGMDVSGKAKLGLIPVDLVWRENFTKAAFRNRYEVSATLDDADRRAVGLDAAPFQAPFLTGPLPTHVVATVNDDGRGEVSMKADLTPVAMRLAGFAWHKDKGEPGTASAQIRLLHNAVAEVPRFALAGPGGLDVQGSVGFEGGLPHRVTLASAKWGRTDLSGAITIKDNGGLAIVVAGDSFDARELLGNARPGEAPPKTEATDATPKMPLTVTGRIGKVWVTDTGALRDVTLALERDTRDWRQVQLDGRVSERKSLHVEIRPAGDGRRNLKITSDDAAAAFRAFDVLPNMRNGVLSVEGHFDDTSPQSPLTGVARVSDYQVVKAPLLARLLTVAALTGAVDVLSGQGIHFSRLEAPFTLADGVLTLKNAHTAGTELGITANGQIDIDHSRLALEGTIVPAYALNSVLGNIPLLGRLFTGGEGGGVFAINYSVKGPMDNPAIGVNPLSALTPGALRGLFDIFRTDSDTQVRAGKPATGNSESAPKPVR